MIEKGFDRITIMKTEEKDSKTKLEGLKELSENEYEKIIGNMEVVMVFMKSRLREYEESTLSLNKEVYNLVMRMSKESKVEKECVVYMIQLINSKLTESKFVEMNYCIMQNLGEGLSSKVVTEQLIETVNSSKK